MVSIRIAQLNGEIPKDAERIYSTRSALEAETVSKESRKEGELRYSRGLSEYGFVP